MLTRLTLRNLAAYRLRLVFTVIAVTLGVSFVSGTMIFRDTAARSFDALYAEAAATADVAVRPRQPFASAEAPQRAIPATLLATLEQKVPGAQSLYGAVDGYAAIVRLDGEVVGGTDTAHVGRSFNAEPGSAMRITSGRAPVTAEEVVVESHTAAEGRIHVGDSVMVVTRYTTRTMRVVGIFTLGEEGFEGLVTFVGFAPGIAQNLLTEPGHYSTIWLRPRPGVSQAQLAAQVSAVLPADYEVKTGQEQAAEVRDEIKGVFDLLGRFLLAFAAISVLVGSFIIFNTFTMLLAQRTRELALLRAVGASRGQVTRAVLGEAIATGLLGSTLGLLAGVGVSFALRLLFQRLGAQLPIRTPVIEPPTVLWSYAVGVVVTVVTAYLPARRASKIPPVAALRDDVALPGRSLTLRLVAGTILAVIAMLATAGGLALGGEEGADLVSVGAIAVFFALAVLGPLMSRPAIRILGWPIARLAGATGRLSRENARRDPRRSAATALALMVGLALVSMATVLAYSTNASVDRKLDREFGADYSMEPRGLTGFGQEAVDRITVAPGVRSVVAVRLGTIKVGADEVSVVVADAAALAAPARLVIESGTDAPGIDELLVQRTLAGQRGWRVGSTVAGQYPDGTSVTLRVVGIFADNRMVNRSYIMSPASYRPHAPTNLVQKAFIDIDDEKLAVGRDGVRSAVRAYPNIELKDRQDAKADARKDVDQLLHLIMALLALSIGIAGLGIANTMGLSVIERTREIGLLRAVGMGRSQVRAMIRYESAVVTLFGAVMGVGVGVEIGWALQRALANEGIDTLSIPVGRLGLYLLVAVAIGVLAAVWPAWRATRLNVLQAIHHD